MTRHEYKILKMYEFAKSLSKLSTCKRASVGCVIVPYDCTSVYAIGYNGQPSGSPNDGCTGAEGDCGCIHAETNAIAKLTTNEACMLISTTFPCWRCAGLIAGCRQISRVLYDNEYRCDRGGRILHRANFSMGFLEAVRPLKVLNRQ